MSKEEASKAPAPADPPAAEDAAKDAEDVLSSSSKASKGSKDKTQSNPPSPIRKRDLWDEVMPGYHKLQTSWSFWYYEKPTKDKPDATYADQMLHVGEFGTVEGFWSYYTRMRRVGTLPKGSSLFLARGGKDSIPSWEMWPDGGHWMVMLRKGGGAEGYGDRLNRLWEQLAIGLLGEAFDDPRVCCAVCNIRPREDQLQVWVDKKDARLTAGDTFQRLLHLGGQSLVEFKSHSQSLKDMSGSKNAQAYRVPGEVAEGDMPTDGGKDAPAPKLNPAPVGKKAKGQPVNTGGRRQSQKGRPGNRTPNMGPQRSPVMVPVGAPMSHTLGPADTPVFSHMKPPIVPPSPGSKALDLTDAPPGYRTPKRTPGNTPKGTPSHSPAGAVTEPMPSLDLGTAAATPPKPGPQALDLVSPMAGGGLPPAAASEATKFE